MPDREGMSYGMSSGTIGPPADPAEGARGRNQGAFHVVAFFVCAGATIVAGIAAVIVSFGTSVCNEADTSDELLELRLGLAVTGLVLTAVPTVFSSFAAKRRFVWAPWAVLAGLSAIVTVYLVGTAEVSTWCLF